MWLAPEQSPFERMSVMVPSRAVRAEKSEMKPISAPLPPPPPPPPPTHVTQQSPPPHPAHAAIPFTGIPPVQETSPPPEAQQDAPATPPAPAENGSVFPASEGPDDNPYDSGEKSGPVQETEPAPQTSPGPQITEPLVEAVVQMDPAAED